MARLWKLVRDDSAATTTEYAIVITLIAVALILAGDAVRLATDSTFVRAGNALGPTQHAAAAAPANEQVRGPSDVPTTRALAAIPATHAFAWGALLVAVAVVVHARYRQQRAKRMVQELHCGPEPVAEEPHNPNFKKRQEIQRVLLRHFDAALHSRIEVRHVMSRTVRTVLPKAPVAELREMMEREGFHHLLVVKQEILLGVISDRDIKGRRGRLAQNVMTASPLTVSPGTQLCHAITMLLHRRISCLPVVENGKVRGILTVTDMMMTLQCLMKLLERSAGEVDAAEASATSAGAERSDSAPAACAL